MDRATHLVSKLRPLGGQRSGWTLQWSVPSDIAACVDCRIAHAKFRRGSFPEREVGAAASSFALDLSGIHVRWFGHWLKEIDNGVEQESPVLLFVMGIDQWRTEADWPLPDTQYRSYYLHSAGQANTLEGDGLLSADLDFHPSTVCCDTSTHTRHKPGI